ncbi:MAG: sugar transferase [Clostridium sp.]
MERHYSLIYLFIKRAFDIITSLIAIIVFSPVFLIIGIMIYKEDKGNIIFGHKRIGKDGKIIKVYKFRSMVMNSQEVFESFTEEQKKEYYENFKLENDPRITKIGGFLRKTSLDELPQLFNILKGDMSVVGPRPIVEKEVRLYGEYAKKLFSVTPGLTGLWQANGRSDTNYDERVQMDMYYIDHAAVRLDIKILFKTIFSVLKKEGAM